MHFFGVRIWLLISKHSISTGFRLKIFKSDMMHFTVNLTVNDASYSKFNWKIIHFTIYLTVKLHRKFNCNITSICNSAYRWYIELNLIRDDKCTVTTITHLVNLHSHNEMDHWLSRTLLLIKRITTRKKGSIPKSLIYLSTVDKY